MHARFDVTKSPLEGFWETERVFNYALGMIHRGDYPYFSAPFAIAFRLAKQRDPARLLTTDLAAALPATDWPSEPALMIDHSRSEIGGVLLTRAIWAMHGTPTWASVVTFFRLLHFLGVLLLFVALLRCNIPGLALFASLGFAYSHAATEMIFAAGYYLVEPIFVLLLGALGAWCIPEKAILPWWARTTLCALGGVAAALAWFSRNSISLAAVLFFALLVIFAFRSHQRREFALAGAFLAAGVLTFLALYPHIWTNERIEHNRGNRHVFWTAVWEGLGEFENPYQFRWGDRNAQAFVYSRDPSLAFASASFENHLRAYVIESVRRDPKWFAGVLWQRLVKIAQVWIEFLPGGSRSHPALSTLLFGLGATGLGVGLYRRQLNGAALFLLTLLWAYAAVPIGIVAHSVCYNLTWYLGLLCSLALGASLGLRLAFERWFR